MWWFKKKVEKSRFEQLSEARDRLRRQIEILRMGPALTRDRTPQTPKLIAELSATVAEIERELKDEKPNET
jgi:hypothetical protein